MDSSCQKERKLENGVDIISDLPDSILEKIQSLLLTNDAIATSMLSKRWNTLSPFSHPPIKLDLEYSPLVKRQHRLNAFVGFVDKLFNSTLLDVPCIETLKLYCVESYGDDKTISWVCSALRLKIRELLLKVSLEQSEALFCGLNGCTTLTRLELGEGLRVLVPDGFRLPNLKMLLLYMLEFHWEDGDMFGKLIYGSPELEDLCLTHCYFEFFEEDESILIKSSVLKKLTLNQCMYEYVELDVPNLEVLQCIDSNANILSSVKSLIVAHIGEGVFINEIDGYGFSVEMNEIEDEDEDGEYFIKSYDVAALVSACCYTVHLRLTSRSIHALQGSNTQFPTFHNLSSLALGRVFTYKGWVLLARLLLVAPNLEKLTFEEGFGKNEGGYSEFKSLLPHPPPCLELHLREIIIEAFNEEEDELKLVKYFLRNGKVIKKLKLQCLPFKETKASRLRMLPKYSKIDFQPR